MRLNITDHNTCICIRGGMMASGVEDSIQTQTVLHVYSVVAALGTATLIYSGF